MGHIADITPEQIARINKLGVGLGPHPWRYLTANNGGPPFRTILNHATVRVGTGLDGARVAPLNPWTGIYFMVTGRNSGGSLVNDGEQISRLDAVRLYAVLNKDGLQKKKVFSEGSVLAVSPISPSAPCLRPIQWDLWVKGRPRSR
jgi:hypothetical protein